MHFTVSSILGLVRHHDYTLAPYCALPAGSTNGGTFGVHLTLMYV